TGRTRPGSKRRDFRFIVKQGLTGCTVPFKSAPGSYTAKFGTLCVQPIPFLLHTVSPPALQPDKLWYFNSSIRDIPKVGYRALFIELAQSDARAATHTQQRTRTRVHVRQQYE
ncbi:unnamed protein product, partial [Closterium sp. NIES-65]